MAEEKTEHAGVEALIRMHTPVVLTTKEYEQLYREVAGRILTGANGISDVICAKMLVEYEYRYHEAKQQNVERGVNEPGPGPSGM